MLRTCARFCFSRHPLTRTPLGSTLSPLYRNGVPLRQTNTRATVGKSVSDSSGGSRGGNGGNSGRKAAAIAGVVGLGAGTLGSIGGVGGSLFVIPGLMQFARISQREAAGCSLFAVSVISTTSAVSYASAGAVDWPIAASLAISAAIASPTGALLSRRVNRATLQRGLAILVLFLAPAMPLRNYLMRYRAESDCEIEANVPSVRASNTGVYIGAGALIGIGSGALGIGGGGLFTAAIAALSDIPLKVVLGTSLAAMVAPSVTAAVTYARMGHFRPALLPTLVIGSVTGAALGSRIALNAPEQILQFVFAAALGLLGVRMLRRPLTLQPTVLKPSGTAKKRRGD